MRGTLLTISHTTRHGPLAEGTVPAIRFHSHSLTRTPPQLYTWLCGLFAALGSVTFGYDLGIIASVLVSLGVVNCCPQCLTRRPCSPPRTSRSERTRGLMTPGPRPSRGLSSACSCLVLSPRKSSSALSRVRKSSLVVPCAVVNLGLLQTGSGGGSPSSLAASSSSSVAPFRPPHRTSAGCTAAGLLPAWASACLRCLRRFIRARYVSHGR